LNFKNWFIAKEISLPQNAGPKFQNKKKAIIAGKDPRSSFNKR
jgi:hypothetical protein